MRYESYDYLWPPRPENKIASNMIGMIERRGWIGQAKKNGTCNVIAVSPEKILHCMNRHNETHKLWAPTPASSEAFRALPGRGWYVFVAELLHSKVSVSEGGVKDTNFINDILVCDGEYLVGQTFMDRQARIADLFLTGGETETLDHYVVTEKTWVAKNLTKGLKAFYDALVKPEDEGVVLKDPKSVLAVCGREKSNVGWSVKSRRNHKNYGF